MGGKGLFLYALVGVLNLQVYSTTELIMLEKNSNMGGKIHAFQPFPPLHVFFTCKYAPY